MPVRAVRILNISFVRTPQRADGLKGIRMKSIAFFEKVTFKQFFKDWMTVFGDRYRNFPPEEAESMVRSVYDNIRLPKRATGGSAGYDFFAPVDITIRKGEALVIPTGIRAWMTPKWVLQIFPRSGLGFKYGMRLMNTVGIIDSDYYMADNEGHIMIKITNDCSVFNQGAVEIPKGKGIAQGVFTKVGFAAEDEVCDKRTGGFGSTDKKEREG